MDSTVDELSASYKEFVTAALAVMEAREQSGGQKTAATDLALESFKQRWELFRVACDHAEELVESIRQRIGSECLVDEATGSSSSAPASAALAAPGIKPISAVRLEQMSKAVRWLVIELQHGAGGPSATGATGGGGGVANSAAGAGGQHGQGGLDPRFPEDGTQ
ncbi:mediator of RNA polymerase II transcription subunit 32 [Brachypodium distachyon]|uniref:Mediator of RNA polymerase II transcription subunit 32 n=1 Tax=Brachypodium distachyon TaxID=15368 RepID=A0A0Q3Q465_BRADI|nr:mediator of RNA polymerase II transcription subunit 32 [Brachypodium distachyon]KQJ96441.1 hypothetical protein BRADI_3g23130v3 [Brachypodium distachyon]|eukprot:XP_003571727.1 mediator of RNA polymerase II transcription subunit 32 [Brachypodium distachyon]